MIDSNLIHNISIRISVLNFIRFKSLIIESKFGRFKMIEYCKIKLNNVIFLTTL